MISMTHALQFVDTIEKFPTVQVYMGVDGPYHKLLTINILAIVALYNEFHACFRC
jgi:hypothetical protein